MSGIENAIIANDACGSPVPWEFCCPWNFFDGKLFHTKWLQATMNFSVTDLCEGKVIIFLGTPRPRFLFFTLFFMVSSLLQKGLKLLINYKDYAWANYLMRI